MEIQLYLLPSGYRECVGRGLVGAVGTCLALAGTQCLHQLVGRTLNLQSSWLLCSRMWAKCLEWAGPGFWQRGSLAVGLCLGGFLKDLIDLCAATA